MNIYSDNDGHMAKMDAMSIYDKTLQKSPFPEPVGRFRRNLVCSIGYYGPSDNLALTLTYFMERSNFGT